MVLWENIEPAFVVSPTTQKQTSLSKYVFLIFVICSG